MLHQVSFLTILFFAIALAFFGIYLGRVKNAGKSKWKLLLYLAIAGILLGAIASAGFVEYTQLALWMFILVHLWCLIIGILHSWLFEKIIPLEHKHSGNILFTLAVGFFGYGLLFLSFKYFFQAAFPRLFFLPFFFFIAPIFVVIAFETFVKIPTRIFKAWDFPVPGTLSDPADSEMADPIIVNFEIRKQPGEKTRTIFKAKAPLAMKLGRLFYFFIIDYNTRHPNNPIAIHTTENASFQWSFYQTANIFKGRMHLDPELSVSENNIKENTSVICERINS